MRRLLPNVPKRLVSSEPLHFAKFLANHTRGRLGRGALLQALLDYAKKNNATALCAEANIIGRADQSIVLCTNCLRSNSPYGLYDKGIGAITMHSFHVTFTSLFSHIEAGI